MIKTWGSNNKKNFFLNIAMGKAAEKKIRQKKCQPLLTFKTCVSSHQTLNIIYETNHEAQFLRNKMLNV
jgi:hypothetical protein